LEFGIESLDAMVRGGVPSGSTTLIFGTSGTGKTLLGLHFLAAGAAKKERGLYLGFNESPQEIVARGEGAKIDLAGYVRRGILEILWEPTTEVILDAIARRVLDIVRRTRVRRL